MLDDTKITAIKRLARIEGQVRGVSKMIDNDRYCIDVVRQVHAVKAALDGLEAIVLEDHLNTCVSTALRSDNLEERQEKVGELVAIMGGRKK